MDSLSAKDYLIGHASVPLWAVTFFFALLATGIMFIYRISRRDKESPRTPTEWDAKFFWRDNILRILATLGFIILSIRIEFIWKLDPGVAIGIGIGLGIISDRLGKLFTKGGDKGVSFLEHKIDDLGDKFQAQETKLNTVKKTTETVEKKVDDVKDTVEKIDQKTEG